VSESYDVVVLGTGAAGLSAALTAGALGASVGVFEKSATVGGTTAVSGGVAWVPAHSRPDVPEPPTVEEAMTYLLAQSNETIDPERVEAYVRGAEPTIEFIEEHSAVRFTVAEGFPDYRPELPGGRPQGGRSFNPSPKDFGELGAWADRVTNFPRDWSNVGFDAETRARMWGDAGFDPDKDIRVCGQALVGGLLQALLALGIEPRTESRGVELLRHGERVSGVVLATPEGAIEVEARLGVVLATGGFEWDRELVKSFLRGPMHGPISPPNNVGDGLRMAMRAGAALGNMREAWWTQVVKLPGDVFEGKERSRSVRLERSRPRSIIVNREGSRFGNEATDYNSLGGAFHEFDPNQFRYPNLPAWLIFDQGHLDAYEFLGVEAGGEAPAWFNRSQSVAELAAKTGIDVAGLEATLGRWNVGVAEERDLDFKRGESAYDGYWGDPSMPTLAQKTLGPIDTAPYYAVPIDLGCTGTKGGPLTDVDAQVLDLDGDPIAGLYAAGNAMAGVTGMAYGGAGGTIGPALVFGHRAAAHAVDKVAAEVAR
jgi:succinate dehydrogenase/fumarate reductase flavoprotein subunit